MNFAIAVLSDIHFEVGKGHPIVSRAEQIAAAISSSATQIETLLIVFSGDIANSGLPEEFAMATSLIAQIKERLLRRLPNLVIQVVAIPGNHDCVLPSDGASHRQAQVLASRKAILDPVPDPFFINDLIAVQKNFWEFAAANADFSPATVSGRICSQYSLSVTGKLVQLNLVNSSLMSQRQEDRGYLLLPTELIKRTLALEKDVSLSISIVHHPPFWIEPTNMTSFRQILTRISDLVITGHEHFTSSYSHTQSSGEQLAFYESPALFDGKFPHSSAFRVLVFDLEQLSQREVLYRWKEGIYRALSDDSLTSWKPLIVNRASRHSFDISPEQMKKLSDVGIAYVQTGTNAISLLDLFVYPDLRMDDAKGTTETVRGANALALFSSCGVVILQGGTFSGKTALCQALYLDLNTVHGRIPILIDGSALDNLDVDKFKREVLRSFKNQYSDPDIDAFVQLEAINRVVIIDNWHLATLSQDQRDSIYEFLSVFAGSSILMVDELFRLRQIVSTARALGTPGLIPSVREAEIVGLSHVSRGRLINKWFRLRKTGQANDLDYSNAAKASEEDISKLLGNDNLPPYAFFVLCMLQAQESKKLESVARGSFGHYHEVLVTTALDKIRSQEPQLDRKFAFCSEVAFYMWKNDLEVVTRGEIDKLVAQYLEKHLLSLQTDKILADLTEARVISNSEGNYRFTFNQFYFYFVARYIKEHFDGEDGEALKQSVDAMVDNISSSQNSIIVMFLIFFANDRQNIIRRLVHNASLIYHDISPAKLEDDAEPFIKRRDYLLPPPIEIDPDLALNREEELVRRDEAALAASEKVINTYEVYGYSEDLPDIKKMHLAERNIEALGQVIRNFSTTLPADLKISVLTTTYNLGLRTMANTLTDVAQHLGRVADSTTADGYSWVVAEHKTTITEFRQNLEKFLLIMGKLVSLHYCKKISASVGVSDNELAYERAMGALPKSAAIKLIDITIQMEHSRVFPESKIKLLLNEFGSNAFAVAMLKFIVAMHLLVYKVGDETRKRMAKLVDLDPKKLETASVQLRKEL